MLLITRLKISQALEYINKMFMYSYQEFQVEIQ